MLSMYLYHDWPIININICMAKSLIFTHNYWFLSTNVSTIRHTKAQFRNEYNHNRWRRNLGLNLRACCYIKIEVTTYVRNWCLSLCKTWLPSLFPLFSGFCLYSTCYRLYAFFSKASEILTPSKVFWTWLLSLYKNPLKCHLTSTSCTYSYNSTQHNMILVNQCYHVHINWQFIGDVVRRFNF